MSRVGPFYGASGISFILTVSAIAGGRPIWTFWGGTARLLVAIRGGWCAVRVFGGAEGALFGLVAASYVASAMMCMAVTYFGLNWRL
jgi:hypothetical protein